MAFKNRAQLVSLDDRVNVKDIDQTSPVSNLSGSEDDEQNPSPTYVGHTFARKKTYRAKMFSADNSP